MAGTNSRVTIELYVDDQGTVRIRDAKAAVEDLAKGNQSVADSAKSAGDNMGAWAGSAQNALVHLAEMVGITLTIAGAFGLIKKGIEEITSFDLGAIASAAMMLSRSGVEGIEAQKQAYNEYKGYVLGMYEALEAETVNHFASGKEMIDTNNALIQRGIYATEEQAKAVGTITDAMKLLHGGYVDQATAMHEIQGLLEGHAGIHFKLAQQLKTMIGPEWKDIVQTQIKSGTLLEFLEEKYKGLSVANLDIQANLKTQESTLSTLLSQIGRGGLEGLYRDIVGLVTDINDLLRENKDSIIEAIAKGWFNIKLTVKDVYDFMQKINDFGKNLIPGENQSGMGDVDTILLGVQRVNDAWKGMSSDFSEFNTNYKNSLTQMGEDLKVGDFWTNFKNSLVQTEKNVDVLIAKIKDTDAWKLTIGTEAAQAAIELVRSNIQWVIDLVSRGYNFIINARVEGLPSWLGGGGGSGSGGDRPGGFGGEGVPRFLGNAPEAPKLTTPNLRDYDESVLRRTSMMPGALVPTTTVPLVPPPSNVGDVAGKGGKGAADTTDSTLSALQQKIDGLLQDIGKINEGTLAGVDAWAKKSINDIAKVAAKNADNIDVQKAVGIAEGLVAEDAAAKKTKIAQDFSLKMYKMAGDTTTELEIQYNEDLKNAARITGGKELLDQAYAIKRRQVQEQASEKIEGLYKSELAAIAGAVPLLSQQLPIQARLLDVEIERNRIKMEGQILLLQNDHRLTEAQANELRGLQAVAAQEQRNAQERKAWMTQDLFGGIKSQALDNKTASETEMAQGFKTAFASSKSYIGDTLGTAIADGLFKKGKLDFQKIGQDLATSMIKKLTQLGVDKIFDKALEGAVKMLPQLTGSLGGGIGAAGATAQATAMTANTTAITALTTSLAANTSALLGETGAEIGGTAAEMSDTAATIADTGITAAETAAVGIEATATSAETLAELPNTTAVIANTIATYADAAMSIFHGGGLVAHSGLLVAHNGLANDERLVKVLTGEPILQRSAMAEYARQGITFDDLNNGRLPAVPVPVGVRGPGGGGAAVRGGETHLHYHDNQVVNAIDARGVKAVLKEHRQTVIEIMNRELGRHGKAPLGPSYG